MIRVRTPARLHFGLFNLGNGEGRRFGGVGLMVEGPGVELEARPAGDWSAEGALADRALAFTHRIVQHWSGPPLQPLALHIRRAPSEHAGLGAGTQLGLAVARAVSVAAGVPTREPLELARLVGRGERSALGIHGFAQGGFLVEAGQTRAGQVSPLVARLEPPSCWRVLLLRPRGQVGLHGGGERRAFAALAEATCQSTDALCRLVLLGMMPALVECDLDTFGDALYEFNYRVGESFSAVQGGPYASPEVGAAVDWLRRQGVRGAGQSSWGPTVFGITDTDRADWVCRHASPSLDVVVATPCLRGAAVLSE